jgi:pyruvate/2-oxoglutarate dehydrogenase complex dihydrolipoamide dehydrogenase (E3) component
MTETLVEDEILAAMPALAPLDAHNRRLLANVHPPDWVNPEPSGRYNLVVVGAGTAGLVTAAGAAGLGAKVALVERQLLGGDCLNVGCVPSKALIRCARAAADVKDAAEFGVAVPDGVRVDFVRVMERLRRLRAEISPHDSARRFRDLGVDVFIGEGRFVGRDALEVGGTRLRFARAVVATGGRASAPPIAGLEAAGFLTNETLFTLTRLPARLAVIGAGPIGCEMAQSFARFGSRVTLLEAIGQVLPREDADAAVLVEQALRRDGVSLRCRVVVQGARRGPGGEKIVLFEHDGVFEEVAVDEILVAVGRAPNVEGLGLEEAGVAYGRTGIHVDDFLRTSNRRILAAGDVCSAYKFTHAADAMARIAIRNALFFGRARASALTIPWCTYTSPELAHVGLSEGEARKRGVAVDTLRVPLEQVDRARLDGDAGLLKLHVHKGTDRIAGATLVARNAGDIVAELTLAISAGVGLKALAATIHPYPTQAEAVKRAADAYNRTRLTPGARRAFERFLAWRR